MPRRAPRRTALALLAAVVAGPAWANDETVLLERNPLLREIGRIAPDRLPWFLAQLDATRHGSGSRGGASPKKEVPLTPRERSAADANPDIADALRIAPDHMVGILRIMLELTQSKAKD